MPTTIPNEQLPEPQAAATAPATRPTTTAATGRKRLTVKVGEQFESYANGSISVDSITDDGWVRMSWERRAVRDFAVMSGRSVRLSMREELRVLTVDPPSGTAQIELEYPLPPKNPFGF